MLLVEFITLSSSLAVSIAFTSYVALATLRGVAA